MSTALRSNDKFDLHGLVGKLYEPKDTMHDWSHIERVYAASEELIRKNSVVCDLKLLAAGLILHGVIYEEGMETRVQEYLLTKTDKKTADAMVLVAWDSQKESRPETLEGGILHDAHLLEGDENFLVTKVLVTGTARGQKLNKTVQYFFDHVVNLEPSFYFDSTKPEYDERSRLAVDFFSKLKTHVGL